MKTLRLLVATGIMTAVMGVAPAHACTDTTDLDGCGKINQVCQKIFKGTCVG